MNLTQQQEDNINLIQQRLDEEYEQNISNDYMEELESELRTYKGKINLLSKSIENVLKILGG